MYLSYYLFIYTYIYLFVYLFIYVSFYLSIHLSIHLSIYLSIYLFTGKAEVVAVIFDMVLDVPLDGIHGVEELATEEADMLDSAGCVQGHVSLLQLCLYRPVRYVNMNLRNNNVKKFN